MFSTFTCLSSILASSPPSEITINSSAVKSLPSNDNEGITYGTYDISENGQCIGIVNRANQYFLSTNGGQTFNYKGDTPSSISAFHMSDTGQYIIAQSLSDRKIVYYSKNSGASWETKTMVNGVIESTGITADGKYAIMSGGYSSSSNVYVSIDYMNTFTNITSVTGTNLGNGIGQQAEGSFIDRQTGQTILMASNYNGSHFQYYLSTDVLTATSSPSFSVINKTNMGPPYGINAYVNGSCFILTTVSPSKVFVSTDSGATFVNASTTIVNPMTTYNRFFFSNDNHIISNADGSRIYYVYDNKIYVSTDKLQTSSIYTSTNVSKDNIIKASSTGKYMLTWNNGLIITTNNLI
jgi:hypothetical protein